VTTVFETDFLSEQGVDYALTGHLHRNGVSVKGSTVHISTGALSGMRWVLPVSVHPRGYRLVQTHAGRLLSAWKPLGEPAVGFVAPDPSPALFASGAERAAPGEIIAFAVDAAGPFEKIGLSADGEPLVAESLGRYFVRAQRPEGARRLELVARRADGSEERVAVESKAREVGDMP
jgi:hypothetical protein